MVYTKNDQKSINFLKVFDFWSFFRYTKEDERLTIKSQALR